MERRHSTLGLVAALGLASLPTSIALAQRGQLSGTTPVQVQINKNQQPGWWKRNFVIKPARAVERASDKVNTQLNPRARYKNIHTSIDDAAAQVAQMLGVANQGDKVTGKIGWIAGLIGGATSIVRGGNKEGTLWVYVNGKRKGMAPVTVDKSGLLSMIFKPYRWGQNINRITDVKVNQSRAIEVIPPVGNNNSQPNP